MKTKVNAKNLIAGTFVLVILLATGAVRADVAEQCMACHGKDGVSTESSLPTIAGYSAAYIADSMKSYKKKERPCPEGKYREGPKKGQKSDMCKVAAETNDADTKAAAKFFAGKKFVRAKQPFDAAKAKRGKEIHEAQCVKCHEKGGSSPDDDAGILAGQWTQYLKQQMADYKSGKRPMEEKMKVKMEKLSADDVDALLNYFASYQ